MLPRTFVAENPAEMERLHSLWTELFRSGEYTLFQSFGWNLLAARVFHSRGAPRVVAIEAGNGAAILPACVADEGLSLLGESLFDYRDLLSAGDETATAMAWKELARPPASLTISALRGGARARWQGMGLPTEYFVTAPCVLRSDVDAATFEAQHHRSGRLLRRLAKLGVAPNQHAGTNRALVRMIYERKAAQALGGENLFADAARREFLVAAAAQSPCDVFTLESAGTLVAAIVTFREGATRRFYTTYFERSWAHYSPGIALLFEATRRSLAEGLDCDYMTGEQPHKLRFATSAVPLYRVHASAEVVAEAALGPRVLAA